MHYEKLMESHQLFYQHEPKAHHYDDYMSVKNRKKWTDTVLLSEVKRLFRFIRKWDHHFRGEEEKFVNIYEKVYPSLKELEGEKIEDADFDDRELKSKVRNVFDHVADCTLEGRYESTDASKILHTIIPDFFVMWDMNIRKGILGDDDYKEGETYVSEFLPIIQKELTEAIETCMESKDLDRKDAINIIIGECDGNSLPKLADQYNYVKYTLNFLGESKEAQEKRDKYREFVEALNELRDKGKISAEKRRELNDRWRKNPDFRDWLIRHAKSLKE